MFVLFFSCFGGFGARKTHSHLMLLHTSEEHHMITNTCTVRSSYHDYLSQHKPNAKDTGRTF